MADRGNKIPDIAPIPRVSMPGGYMLGRVSPGVGPVQLIPISAGAGQDVAKAAVVDGGGVVGTPTGGKQTIGFQFPVAPAIGTYIGAASPYTLRLPAAVDDSVATAFMWPLWTSTLLLKSPTLGLIATVTFAGGAVLGSIVWAATAVTLPAGEAPYIEVLAFTPTLSRASLLFVGDTITVA